MPRANPIRAVYGKSLLIGLVVATGCVNSRTDLQDRLAQRVMPADVEVARPTSQPLLKASDRATTDAKVLPAVASQLGQGTEARTENGRSTPLPAALEGPPRGVEADRSPRLESH
jgi:hypothetical protein